MKTSMRRTVDLCDVEAFRRDALRELTRAQLQFQELMHDAGLGMPRSPRHYERIARHLRAVVSALTCQESVIEGGSVVRATPDPQPSPLQPSPSPIDFAAAAARLRPWRNPERR
jgi:hypothetical protein